MQLIIDGKVAVLKKGSSFDYVSENRSFSDADDYSLSISLPLAGCPENLEIFGHVDRMDIDSRHIVLEASIIGRTFSKNGIVTVVEATEVEVKVQFLEGRSVQNFMTTFEDVYINELPLGSYPTSLPKSPAYGGIEHGSNYVALPWVNDSSNGFMNNEVVTKDGSLQWADSTKEMGKLSYMPYLIFIARKICTHLGYTYDFSQWENSMERCLLICNALPATWDVPQIARALPRWTVSEFFEELEKILVCEININHKTKHIGLTFCDNVEWNENEVLLENVVDSFSSEVSYTDELCKFKGVANLRYADRGDSTWKYDQCQWLVELLRSEKKYYREFETNSDFANWAFSNLGPTMGVAYCTQDEERGDLKGILFHIKEDDTYRLLRVIPTVYHSVNYSQDTFMMGWLQVNRFGDVIKDHDSDNDIELSMLPVRIDETDEDHGLCVFLAPSGFDENEDLDSDGIRQPVAFSSLLKGEPDSEAEYYDKIYLAYWDGRSANADKRGSNLLPPCPYVDERFNLGRRYKNYLSGLIVNPREKMKISWIGNAIPDVRAVFHIRGKRYLCEKITATFTENGMSQLLKGEFYPLSED